MATNGEPTMTVARPNHLAHVVLKTPNFKASVAFYKAFFGGHASFENPGIAFITYDHEHHRIAIANVPHIKPKDKGTAGLEHIAFGYDRMEDWLLAYKQRKSIGMLPIWCTNHGPNISIYYQDPDGNQLETQVDVYDTVEETNAFMMTDEFAQNPVGVDFDPEDLIRRFKAGESEKSLKTRQSIGPRSFAGFPLSKVPAPDLREEWPALGKVEL